MSTAVVYKPYTSRVPDFQYQNLLRQIMTQGRVTRPPQGEEARQIVGATLVYDLENGFPLITERDVSPVIKGAVGEIIAFTHGERTLEGLEGYGCPRVYWERWVTPDKCAIFGLAQGDLGDGSYGAQFGKPVCEGGEFSQVEAAIQLAKDMPNTRTVRISTWRLSQFLLNADPKKRRTVVAPCHGDVTVILDSGSKTLQIHHVQRSGDVPVGVVGNIVQYAAFGMMFAQVLGYTMTRLTHHIIDAHIYERQYPYVEQLLKVEPRAFPTVILDPGVKNYFAFRREHFSLSDYYSGPKMQIPTPV